MFMHNLPSAFLSLIANRRSKPMPCRRMIGSHAGVSETPVRECQVVTNVDSEVSRLHLEGGREVRQSRLPYASPGRRSFGLEWGVHAKDGDIRGVV